MSALQWNILLSSEQARSFIEYIKCILVIKCVTTQSLFSPAHVSWHRFQEQYYMLFCWGSLVLIQRNFQCSNAFWDTGFLPGSSRTLSLWFCTITSKLSSMLLSPCCFQHINKFIWNPVGGLTLILYWMLKIHLSRFDISVSLPTRHKAASLRFVLFLHLRTMREAGLPTELHEDWP